MRVLITTDTVGGVWTFTHELAEGLLQHGYPVLLVSFGGQPSVAQHEQCVALERDYPGRFRCVPTDVPLEWMENNERTFEEGARVLREEIRRFAPDVIHANQFCFGALATQAPRVITAHSDLLSWARSCGEGKLPSAESLRRYVSLVQAGLSGCHAVAAPTRWMLQALEEGFSVPSETFVIESGRSIAVRFDGPREVRAVTAGRLADEAKGIRLLQDVQSPVPLIIAGDNTDAHRLDLPAGTKAHFTGQLSEPELIDLFQQSSMYLCLSHYETFGLTPLEAALCGCAVVARELPSLVEVWDDGALYFKDAAELSRVLAELNADPELLHAARERSYARARRFTRERMVDGYLDLYRRVWQHAENTENVA